MKLLDNVRARAHAALGRVPGKVGESLRRANEALGRPLADADELAARRAFESHETGQDAPAAKTAASAEAAPVIVYHMDKQRRDVPKVLDILDANGVP